MGSLIRKTICITTVMLAMGMAVSCSYAEAEVSFVSASPDEAVVSVANARLRKWYKTYKRGSSKKYRKKGENCYPVPVRISWRVTGAKGASYVLRVYDARGEFSVIKYKTDKKYVNVKDLLADREYCWTVTCLKDGVKHVSPVYSFTTARYPRTVKVGGVSNFRDIGGCTAAGGVKVRQNMVYRSARLDKITRAGRKKLIKKLGIRSDLDLRRKGEGKAGKGSPLGSQVKYFHKSGVMYDKVFASRKYRKYFVREMKVFASDSNYPIVFHCTYGRDRTGTLEFMLNGLLGVSKKDLYRNYELSFLSVMGSHGKKTVNSRLHDLDRLYKYMRKYRNKNKPLSYNIECFLLDNGMSKKEISRIRAIMLDQ